MNDSPAETADNLPAKAARSGLWSFLLRFNHQLFFIGRIVILARLLAPDDFGLMSLALLTMMFVDTFTQTGMFEALIQKKARSDQYLNAAWTFSAARGLFLFLILFALSYPAAGFFHVPEITRIIQVMSLSVVLTGFTNVGVMHFQKELEFRKQFIWQASLPAANFLVAVACALILKNVWALVFGQLAASLTQLVVSYLLHPYRPRLEFNLSKIRELLGFGRWVLWSSIILFFLLQGDDLIVGKLLGAATLGFYHLAYKLSNIPTTEVSSVISQVSFPLYAKLQSHRERLLSTFLQVLRLSVFISLPLSALIVLSAPDVIPFVLGTKWRPIVFPTQLLCLYGLTRMFIQTTGMVFFGTGKPRINTIANLLQLIVMAVLIYPLTVRFGLTGTIFAVIIPNFVSLAYNIFHLKRDIGIRGRDYRRALDLPVISVLVLSSVVLVVKLIFPGHLPLLAAAVLLGGGSALGLTYLKDRSFYTKIFQLVLGRASGLSKNAGGERHPPFRNPE